MSFSSSLVLNKRVNGVDFWPHLGTVKCKISRSSGGFVPWTPTRTLAWTCWGLTAPSDPQLHKAISFGTIKHNSKFPFNCPKTTEQFLCYFAACKVCLVDSPNPGTFSSLPGVKSVLPGEFFLFTRKYFRDHWVCYRGVL